MKFKENQSIYLQIADRLCDEILIEKYQEEERIPSVREYAALVEVNVNTIVRTYEYLQGLEIIYTKRGLGYFVTPGAKDCILQLRRRHFLQEELPEFFKQLQLLNISIDEIKELYKEKQEHQF
jgi:DNA-binding transcriptional regulator YhcF (GntR family)